MYKWNSINLGRDKRRMIQNIGLTSKRNRPISCETGGKKVSVHMVIECMFRLCPCKCDYRSCSFNESFDVRRKATLQGRDLERTKCKT